jgi:hypothetical protein
MSVSVFVCGGKERFMKKRNVQNETYPIGVFNPVMFTCEALF